MSYIVTQAASVEPLRVEEARAHLRICCADEDAYLAYLIGVARELTENEICTPLGLQTRDYFFQAFACELVLSANLATVDAITYVDADGVTQTLAPASYQVDTVSQPGKVMHVADSPWPEIAAHTLNPIKVTVTAGYADAASVPKTLKHAMLLMVGSWYENREDETFGKQLYPIPLGVKRLLDPFRIFQ